MKEIVFENLGILIVFVKSISNYHKKLNVMLHIL